MRRGDYLLFAITGALFAFCHFVLFVPNPLIHYAGDPKNQKELTETLPLLEVDGSLARSGWARQPVFNYNPEKLARFSQLPVLSTLHHYRLKEWERYTLWNDDYSFTVGISDFSYIAKVSVSFVDFKTRQYFSTDYTVPTSELSFPSNIFKVGKHVELTSSTFGVRAIVSVSSDKHRTVELKSATFSANFTLKPTKDQEYLTIAAPIGSSNFYYNTKLYNSISEGFVKIENDAPVAIGSDTHSLFEYSRGKYDYRSNWAKLVATMTISGGRKLTLNFGTGLGDQSSATENALIIDEKIYKLGHITITYDENSLMNPWILTSSTGMRIVFAPFVEFQVESSKTYVMLSNRIQQVFGKFLGTINVEGEEVDLQDVTGCAEVYNASW